MASVFQNHRMNGLPIFDNHDEQIQYYELLLERNLENIPFYDLPYGYHFEFYKKGDRDIWIEIERSAKEFSNYMQGMEAWNKFYSGKERELSERMVFVVNGNGEKVATATAFYDVNGRDQSGAGWVHWVSVRRDYQGKGLSKPLLSKVLEVMKELGYGHAKIPTQTTTWLACKIYLDLGFLPVPQNAIHSRDGWRIVKRLTNHPSLVDFDSAEDSVVLNKERAYGKSEISGITALTNRRSIRKYKNTPVEKHLIEKILLAGSLAPSSKNRQPWHFVVVTDGAKEEMLSVMRQGLEREKEKPLLLESACYRSGAKNTLRIMKEAPVIIFVVNTLALDLYRSLNPEERIYEICNMQSIGAAMENMALAATELGLGSLWICDTYFAWEELNAWLEADGELVAAMAVGYAREAPDARPRKSLNDIVTWRS